MILDEDSVRALLRMDELIPAMANALADLSRGKVVQPMRVMMPVGDHGGFLGLMPAYGGALGAKLVTFYPSNEGVPTHHALVLLFRPETGEPLVTMDGRLITEMRTAAVSAVATKLLARPEASVLAILGSGVQARSHLEALRLVHAADSAAEAVRGADVVVVATTSRVPVLFGQWLSPGTHINAVGAPRPTWRELDDEILRTARIYVESREAATRESGDIIAAGRVDAEIGEVVTGAMRGRESAGELTLFKSVGVAVEDVVTADLVYRKARAQRV